MDKKVFVIVILAGLLLWQLWAQRVRNRAEPLAGRFIRLGNGSVWEHREGDSFYPGWTALSLTESTLAFDTATGQICRTNTYPHLFEGDAGLPDLQEGPDGKPEPIVDPTTGQPRRRQLPVCVDLSKD